MSSMAIAADIAKIVEELYLLRLTIKDLHESIKELLKGLKEAQFTVLSTKP